MGELVPSYPQPYRLFNPLTGHPLFSGPNGQPGYATAQPQADSWVQPDGVRVWFYDTSTPDPNNRVALGLDVSSPNDPGIGYVGAYEAAGRHGANPTQADLFAAIAMAESSAHWSDHNNNSRTGDDSIGLWQINLRAHPQYRAINLYNIDANAQAASEVSGGWANATPWSTFTSGAYKQFLRGGTAPVGQIIGQLPPPPPPPGPVTAAVDAIIRGLPDPNIFGFHPRDLLNDALDPMARAIDAALALVLGGLSRVSSWVDDAVRNVTGIVQPIIAAAVRVVEDAVGAIIHVVDQAWRAGVAAVDAAWRWTVGVVDAAWRVGVGELRAALDYGVQLLRDAISGVERSLTAALDFGISALRAVISATEAVLRDAIHLAVGAAEGLARDLVAAEHALWRDAVGAVEAALRDAIGAVDGAWRAFVRDVFGPVERELRHLVDDVVGPIEPLLHALGQLGEWIVEAARVVVIGPKDVYDTIHELARGEVKDEIVRQHGLSVA